MLLESSEDSEDTGFVAQCLIDELAAPVRIACGAEVSVGASIGISLFPQHGDCWVDLLQHADAALYQAKKEGRNTFRSFIRDAATDSHDATLVRLLIGIAKDFKLTVVAKGVETERQCAFLREQGCDAYLGYLYSPPVSQDEFNRLILDENASPD